MILVVQMKIRNGTVSERGLARNIGLSQPHLHNVLKGARKLTPEVADRLLYGLHLSVIDLLRAGEGSSDQTSG